jgi:hypothetical protein
LKLRLRHFTVLEPVLNVIPGSKQLFVVVDVSVTVFFVPVARAVTRPGLGANLRFPT